MSRKKIPEMKSVAKNASPSFVYIKKVDIFSTLDKIKGADATKFFSGSV